MHKSGMPQTQITGREWRATVGESALDSITVENFARDWLSVNQETRAPRTTREDLQRTNKLCVGGLTVRDLCSAAVENA